MDLCDGGPRGPDVHALRGDESDRRSLAFSVGRIGRLVVGTLERVGCLSRVVSASVASSGGNPVVGPGGRVVGAVIGIAAALATDQYQGRILSGIRASRTSEIRVVVVMSKERTMQQHTWSRAIVGTPVVVEKGRESVYFCTYHQTCAPRFCRLSDSLPTLKSVKKITTTTCPRIVSFLTNSSASNLVGR